MIVETFYRSRMDGKIKLIKRVAGVYAADGKTVSPTGFKIRQIGTDELFDEAIDIRESNYQYIETDVPVDGTTVPIGELEAE